MKFYILLSAFIFSACTATQNSYTKVYFSEPGADVEDTIVNYIRTAQHQVLVQAYGFTSEAIFEVLDSLHESGVDVSVILDKSNETSAHSKLKSLKSEKIMTMIDDKPAIAHCKIIIIDGAIVITGSYNWTEHSKKNVENIVVIADPDIAQKYIDEWNGREGVSRKPKRR
jgi:phospholipase D